MQGAGLAGTAHYACMGSCEQQFEDAGGLKRDLDPVCLGGDYDQGALGALRLTTARLQLGAGEGSKKRRPLAHRLRRTDEAVQIRCPVTVAILSYLAGQSQDASRSSCMFLSWSCDQTCRPKVFI